jgi:hypothetical protein
MEEEEAMAVEEWELGEEEEEEEEERGRKEERGVGGTGAVMTAVAFSMAYKSLQVVVAAFWKPPLSRAFSVFQPLFLPQCFLSPSSPPPPLSTLPLLLHRTKKALTCSSLPLALSLSHHPIHQQSGVLLPS